MDFLKTEADFWTNIANTWSLQNKNPVVGWYNEHNAWPDYETVLFDGIETKDKVILEYGCGPGRNLIRFSTPKWGFRSIDGVDISDQNIVNASLNINMAKFDSDYDGSFSNIRSIWANDGKRIDKPDNFYDIVFSVITLQHIINHNIRQFIYSEIFRVLKPGGKFTAQMGFGPGHPRSVEYYATPEIHEDKDVRVEDITTLKSDLETVGFKTFRYVFRPTVHDEHPTWVWFQCQKLN